MNVSAIIVLLMFSHILLILFLGDVAYPLGIAFTIYTVKLSLFIADIFITKWTCRTVWALRPDTIFLGLHLTSPHQFRIGDTDVGIIKQLPDGRIVLHFLI